MTDQKRIVGWGAVAALGLALLVWWNLDWMSRQKALARQAAQDKQTCVQLAEEIAALRQQPTLAAEEDLGVQVLGERINAALQQAGLSGAMLEGVFPQSARRVASTAYLEKPTDLNLRGVALAPLATFLYHLTAAGNLRVQDLRLRSPRGVGHEDSWDAEVTLTYLIYSPMSQPRRP